MNSAALLKQTRDAIIAGTLAGLNGTYISGSVNERAKLPYAVVSMLPGVERVTATDTREAKEGVQVDVYASTLGEALAMSDSIDALILASAPAAIDEAGESFGLEHNRNGPWRVVFPSEPETEGANLQRVAQLYEATEFRNA